MTTATMPMQAWCNDYEVVAARSVEEAREVVRRMNAYDEEELDGEGWLVLKNDTQLRDESGEMTGETVADVLLGVVEPTPLWSCAV
jgi:hypothetical protein